MKINKIKLNLNNFLVANNVMYSQLATVVSRTFKDHWYICTYYNEYLSRFSQLRTFQMNIQRE